MLTRIAKADWRHRRRVLATSDIHAHPDELRAVLKAADYAPEEDALVICGDLLEKGRKNLETLRLVMELAETGEVCTLVGNADVTLLNLLTGDSELRRQAQAHMVRNKGWWGWTVWDEVCAELGLAFTPEMDFEAVIPRARRHLAREIDFLAALPTVLDTPDRVFVHAGLTTPVLSALEGRDNDPLIRMDDFFHDAPAFDKTVVAGHWPVSLLWPDRLSMEPLADEKRNILCIDGGMGVKRMGQINLLCFAAEGGGFTSFGSDSLPRCRALAAQSASPGRCLRWTNRFVDTVRAQGDMSEIVQGGERMLVPTAFLYDGGGGRIACDDVTDARLEVRAGDILHGVEAVEKGIFCKLNGLCGWYDGPAEWL